MADSDPDFDPPRQERSRRTYERIIEAANGCFEHRSFQETSVREIIRRAGCTEGSFFARFSSKQGFLHHLADRISGEQRDLVTERLENSRDPVLAIRGIVRDNLRLYRRWRGICRALILHARSHEDLQSFIRLRGSDIFVRIEESILAAGIVDRPDADEAVRFALLMLRATLHDAVLFDDLWNPERSRGDDFLVEELTTAFFRYLEFEPEGN